MDRQHTLQDMSDETETAPRRGLSAIGLPLRIAGAAAIVGALAFLARAPHPAPLVPTLQPTAQVPALLGVAPLRLTEPGIDAVRVEPGRIDPRTGLREDVLGRGAFTAIEAPVLRLAVTRGRGAETGPGLFVLLARRAGRPAAGEMPLAVLRTGTRGVVATRFGIAETAEATLEGTSTRTCTGFVVTQPTLRIDGFLCAPLGQAPEARSLACTLDALTLDDAADPTATALFRGARARSDCERPGPVAADPVGRTGSIARVRRGATKN